MAPLRSWSLALPLGLCALLACGDDGGDGGTTAASATEGSASESASASASASAGSGSASAGETTGGGGSGGTDTGAPEGVIPPILGVPNVDDDDEDGKADWNQVPFASDNDLTTFALPAWYLEGLADGDKVELTLAGEVDQVRLWRGEDVLLGDAGGSTPTTATLSAADAAALELRVEWADFMRGATLTIRHLGSGGSELAVDEVELWSAPMLVNHHLQPAEYVWGVPVQSNGSMINEFKKVLGDRFISISSMDVWIQDELEWALATAPGKRLNIAVDSIRDRPLDAFVKGLKAPDIQPMTWGVKGTQTTEDKFGNLEVTPPHTAGGVAYPHGRIYYGKGATCGPNQILTDHLARQKVQRPIEVNTCWLCVGHVDEYISFVPDPSSPKGFKFLIADVDAAYELLDALPGNTAIPRYGDSHGYATIGELVGDNTLRALNQDIQADYIDPVREQLKAELDLDESDIVRIPGIFERIWGCSYKDNGVAALIPGMLNLVVVNVEDGPLRIFVSDPFMRPNGVDQASDPLIANFKAALPDEYEIHFVDDWYTYHVAIGEVHCGTNVMRTPTGAWWEDSRHLFTQP
ncbi:MAG: hypothetical protein KC420_15780 [Myxococcales bacterium]|nr:hypothetical protein [Myxococcales bacterium]